MERRMKKNSCVLIKQYVHVGHHIMMSQHPIHIFTSEAQFLAYIFYLATSISHVVLDNQKREILFL